MNTKDLNPTILNLDSLSPQELQYFVVELFKHNTAGKTFDEVTQYLGAMARADREIGSIIDLSNQQERFDANIDL